MDAPWDTPDRLQQLLCTLVGWGSVTGSEGEVRFAGQLAGALRSLPLFTERPELVALGPVDGGGSVVTALYRAEGVADTIVLVSHFDTVDTADYGPLEAVACDPERLAEGLRSIRDELDAATVADLDSGEWLFGRGTMDMKMGLALHMALLERAHAERWPINLLLVAVPDEEVNSAGMRRAIDIVRELAEEGGLDIRMFLNGEPTFPAHPGDTNRYVYSGSIGKLLPSALCYGRETHAGTPLAGLTSSYVASFLTQAMEWNDAFRETVHGESTQLPVTLLQRDLKDGYSTQTPFRTSVLYNVFVMEQGADDVLARFEATAIDAAERCMREYRTICEREGTDPVGDLRVIRFERLLEHATGKLGAAEVERISTEARASGAPDLREQSMRIADALLLACQELTPAIVVLFAPPYYPPVNSSDDPLVQACIERVLDEAQRQFGTEVTHLHWFNGISDLSYASGALATEGWRAYERNMPGYGASYELPFESMRAVAAPVLNVGPFGKDPHKRTERLHLASAFHELPVLLADLVQFVATRITAPR